MARQGSASGRQRQRKPRTAPDEDSLAARAEQGPPSEEEVRERRLRQQEVGVNIVDGRGVEGGEGSWGFLWRNRALVGYTADVRGGGRCGDVEGAH